jgi:hypothetical protein
VFLTLKYGPLPPLGLRPLGGTVEGMIFQLCQRAEEEIWKTSVFLSIVYRQDSFLLQVPVNRTLS